MSRAICMSCGEEVDISPRRSECACSRAVRARGSRFELVTAVYCQLLEADPNIDPVTALQKAADSARGEPS